MREERPFYRVSRLTKYEAACQQIDAAIVAFHHGQFAVAITLAGAAEGMSPAKEGGLWERVREHPDRPKNETKEWIAHLNETRDWLKHVTTKNEPAKNLVAFEVGFAILRAMDKWEPWTDSMLAFKELWFSSPKLMHPAEYDGG